ncbi:hypothetical protein PhCBS80983_g01961 [Powellomyces hirtus]|uniref:Uncharacterized protein n=1 Tax=Powellomyces hirtus TaxID=109895 RepID=A0A507E8U5_9FUNG|nr:hypothetical protein PhCBS80983_g01961 [Powellomyces hirtus]
MHLPAVSVRCVLASVAPRGHILGNSIRRPQSLQPRPCLPVLSKPSFPTEFRLQHSSTHKGPKGSWSNPDGQESGIKLLANDLLIDLSYRAWAKLILVAITGITAGCLAAEHGSALLAHTGIFVYQPDDDDDDEDDTAEALVDGAEGGQTTAGGHVKSAADKQEAHSQELAALFGDFRVNLAYNWTAADATYVTLAREKLHTSLHELDAIVAKWEASPTSTSTTAQDKKEVALIRKFLQDNLDLLDARARELATLPGSSLLGDPVADAAKRPSRWRRWVGLS